MKIPRLSLMNRTTRGFTLVELLVVISIIAVLMGLLFPTIGAVMNNARKTEAKNDVMQIVTAIRAYYTDYGRYPTLTSPALETSALDDGQLAELLAILRSDTTTTPSLAASVNSQNPRRIVFIEGKEAKPGPTPKSGFSGGLWYDPWGKVYQVVIDTNYNNEIANPITGGTPAIIRTGAVAWSTGVVKDGQPTGEGATDQRKAIVSWQ